MSELMMKENPAEKVAEPAMKAKPKERNIAEGSGLFFAVVTLAPGANGIYKKDIDRMRNGEDTEARGMMADNLRRSGFTRQEAEKFINVLIAKVEAAFDKMEKGISIMEMTGQHLDIGLNRPLTVAEKAVLIAEILGEPITGKNAPVDVIRLAKEGYLDKKNIIKIKRFAGVYKHVTEELGKVSEKTADKFNEIAVTEGILPAIKFLKNAEKGQYRGIVESSEKKADLESEKSAFAKLPDINILAMSPVKMDGKNFVERDLWARADKTESVLKERAADMKKTAEIVDMARIDALAKYSSENA